MFIICKGADGEEPGCVAVGGKANFSLNPDKFHIDKYVQRLFFLFLSLINHNFINGRKLTWISYLILKYYRNDHKYI